MDNLLTILFSAGRREHLEMGKRWRQRLENIMPLSPERMEVPTWLEGSMMFRY